MNYKHEHLAKFCCKPQNETEFEAVKMAAELGGVKWCTHNDGKEDYYNTFGLIHGEIVMFNYEDYAFKPSQTISIYDFIKKLRMTEEEAMALEDDRVKFSGMNGIKWTWSVDDKSIIALNGHHFRLSEDGKTVTLHKNEQ